MKTAQFIFFITIFLLTYCTSTAQENHIIDSLQNELTEEIEDLQKIKILQKIGDAFEYHKLDSALLYFEKVYVLAKENGYTHEIANALISIGVVYKNLDKYKIANEKYQEALEQIENSKDKSIESRIILARIYVFYGESYRYLSNYKEALKMYNNSLEITNNIDTTNSQYKTKIKEIQADCYNNTGLANLYQGDYSKAVTNYQKSLKIQMSLGNLKSISNSYTNIGNVHFYQGNYEKSIEYYTEALKTFEKLNHKKGIFACLTNIGSVQLFIGKKAEDNDAKLKKFYQAIEYYEKALKISEETKNKRSIADCLGNIGVSYSNIAFFSDNSPEIYGKAIECYHKSLKIKKEIEDDLGTATCYLNISSLNNKKKNYNEAILIANKSLEISNKIGVKKQKKTAYESLCTAYEGLNNIPKAYEYFKLSILIKDSLFNEKKSEQLTEMEERFQSEKKQLKIDKLTSEKALQDVEMKKQRILILSFIFGFVIILLFSILLYRQFTAKKRANILLELQNEDILQKNEEITAQRDEIEAQRNTVTEHKEKIEEIHDELTGSIRYAEHIQSALLPTGEILKEIFTEHFVLFKPHSVVSGDFYWTTKVNEHVIVAVADCTGHGVPGAFMSMLGMSFLNEIVRHTDIVNANTVLNELRKKVIFSLKQKGEFGDTQSGSGMKDGMDISLCAISTKTNKLQFAGANNPLYIVRNVIASKAKQSANNKRIALFSAVICNDEYELAELKGDRMPIAIYERMEDFTNHEIKIEKGDCLYLFSDGYIDQFGGEKGKRFMSKRFKALLLENADKTMDTQKEILLSTLEKWQGTQEQIDDIAVLGLKI